MTKMLFGVYRVPYHMGVSEVSCLNTTRGYSWDHGKALENDWKLVGMGKSLLTDYLKIGLELIFVSQAGDKGELRLLYN